MTLVWFCFSVVAVDWIIMAIRLDNDERASR
jgi:hypothetical protein